MAKKKAVAARAVTAKTKGGRPTRKGVLAPAPTKKGAGIGVDDPLFVVLVTPSAVPSPVVPAGRVLGVATGVPVSSDVSDRAARALGVVSSITAPVTPYFSADTTNGAAAVAAAPGAGAAVATVAAPGAGTYEVLVTTAFTLGAPAAADVANMRLQRSATAPLNLVPFITPPALNVPTTHRVARVTLAAAETISVNAIAAATAGVSYAAEIILQRVA